MHGGRPCLLACSYSFGRIGSYSSRMVVPPAEKMLDVDAAPAAALAITPGGGDGPARPAARGLDVPPLPAAEEGPDLRVHAHAFVCARAHVSTAGDAGVAEGPRGARLCFGNGGYHPQRLSPPCDVCTDAGMREWRVCVCVRVCGAVGLGGGRVEVPNVVKCRLR
eukprot:126910-Chlamydomonas_euryale.AAC.1